MVMVQGEAGAVLGVTAMESRDIRASTAGPGCCTTPPPPSTALTSAISSLQSVNNTAADTAMPDIGTAKIF